MEKIIKILTTIPKLYAFAKWLFSGQPLANFITTIVTFTLFFAIRNIDLKNVESMFKTVKTQNQYLQIEDPKTRIQAILKDLSLRCGDGCYSMLISLSIDGNFIDGKPYSVFGLAIGGKYVIEVSSMAGANAINIGRFSIGPKTAKDLIYDTIPGKVEYRTIDAIKNNYSELESLLFRLQVPIERYIYIVQRNEQNKKNEPLWVIAIAITKKFQTKCFTDSYNQDSNCERLLMDKAKDIYTVWIESQK